MAKKHRTPIPEEVLRALHASSFEVMTLSPQSCVGSVKKMKATCPHTVELDGMRIDEVALLFLAPGAEILPHTHEKGQCEAYFEIMPDMGIELDGTPTKSEEWHSLKNNTNELLIRLAIKYRML